MPHAMSRRMAETWVMHRIAEIVSRRIVAPLTEAELAEALSADPAFAEQPQPEETLLIAVPADLSASAALSAASQLWAGEREIVSLTFTGSRVMVVERV
jgi:hypothetical protein